MFELAINIQPCRLCILLYIVMAKNGVWFVENPTSSLMPYHPRFADLCRVFKVGMLSFEM